MTNKYFIFLIKTFPAFLLFLCTATASFSQSYNSEEEALNPQGKFEFGVQIGSNNFLGDLGGHIGKGTDFAKDYMLKTVKPFGGISLNYYPYAWLNIIAGLNLTQVAGADSLISNENGYEKWRYYRNLSFKSSIFEGYIGAEVYPLVIFQDYQISRFRLQPYVGLGIGFFHFNPKANYNGQWVDLKPLRLEGQGFSEYPDSKPYNLTQLYIPLTGGLKYVLNENYSLLGGLIFRYTNTDYIDDVGGKYIDPTLFNKYLPATQAALAKQLYSRSRRPEKVRPGVDRADSDGNRKDSYVSFFIGLRIALSHSAKYYDCWKN